MSSVAVISLNIPENEVLFERGNSKELQKAHCVFEAQLGYTMNMIKQLEAHPHFTDDCGEYLAGALELSFSMQNARQEGVQALYDQMMELLKEGNEVASDSYSKELVEWMEEQGKNWDG